MVLCGGRSSRSSFLRRFCDVLTPVRLLAVWSYFSRQERNRAYHPPGSSYSSTGRNQQLRSLGSPTQQSHSLGPSVIALSMSMHWSLLLSLLPLISAWHGYNLSYSRIEDRSHCPSWANATAVYSYDFIEQLSLWPNLMSHLDVDNGEVCVCMCFCYLCVY
ncbi:hypothetical protein B484DRAFT_262163 [Ochromonadaceae sp. CCMP2298]|nr:hypothetical protein B484DRAFT_262163 [Ochromonadaceae sp. CCMP2298]